MSSAVYLHDGEHQITVTFRKEEDRERFKAHYRALDALGVQWRDERDAARATIATQAAEITRLNGLLVGARYWQCETCGSLIDHGYVENAVDMPECQECGATIWRECLLIAALTPLEPPA